MATTKKAPAKPRTYKITKQNVETLIEAVVEPIAPAVRKAKAKQPYFLEFTTGQDTYHGAGETAYEAVEALNEAVPTMVKKYPKIKGTFSFTKDGRLTQKFLYPVELKRFFTNHLTRQMYAKACANSLG